MYETNKAFKMFLLVVRVNQLRYKETETEWAVWSC